MWVNYKKLVKPEDRYRISSLTSFFHNIYHKDNLLLKNTEKVIVFYNLIFSKTKISHRFIDKKFYLICG